MKHIHFLCVLIALCTTIVAQPTLDFQELILTGPSIVTPVDITGSGDGTGRLFVVEKSGTIRIIMGNEVLPDYFLNISSKVESGGERGLLGLAFHPDFPTTPYFYVNYVGFAGPDTTYISRFMVNPANPNDAFEQSELVLIKVRQPFANHNAGDLAFSPIDGYLYIPLGDGGFAADPEESGQDSMSLLGKILRIDVDAASPYIPASNPFASNPNILDEIWAFGVRNPWRISFDRSTGDLWIGDVGQDMWEEVNFQPAGSSGGENYGWDCYEGNHSFESTDCQSSSSYVFPVFEYPHNCSQGCPLGTGNSLTGGFVYRGSDYPSLNGYYICADYGSENIWLIDQSFNVTVQSGNGVFSQLSTFGEGDDGELYAADIAENNIYRVTVDGILPLHFISFTVDRTSQSIQLQWRVENAIDVLQFDVQRSLKTLSSFETIGTVAPDGDNTAFVFEDTDLEAVTVYYRIRARFKDGKEKFSSIRSSAAGEHITPVRVHTNAEGLLVVHSEIAFSTIDMNIYQTDGTLVLSRSSSLSNIQIIGGTKHLRPGVYVVTLEGLPSGPTAVKWYKQH